MKQFFDKFQEVKSASIVAIKKYENSKGEIADVRVNININTHKHKVEDCAKLKAITPAELETFAKKKGYPVDVMETALAEMIVSADKNLSENKEDRTKQSIAQAETYIHLTPSLKMHKKTMDVYVTGFFVSKDTIHVEGEYGDDTRRIKTKCKDAIKKEFNLRMRLYRPYKVGNMEKINITGETVNMETVYTLAVA